MEKVCIYLSDACFKHVLATCTREKNKMKLLDIILFARLYDSFRGSHISVLFGLVSFFGNSQKRRNQASDTRLIHCVVDETFCLSSPYRGYDCLSNKEYGVVAPRKF